MNSLSILYAEDEELTRVNYAKYLRRFFKEVYEAKDGDEAYSIYLEKKPEILLLDIDMPKLDGLEVAKKIRQSDKISRIIMLTAIKDTDKLIFATELNLTKYLPKPIQREELKNALKLSVQQFYEINVKIDEFIAISSDLKWSIEKNELFFENEAIKLTKYEIRFFKLLLTNVNQFFSQEKIITFVWGEDALLDYNPSRLKNLVKRVRKKLPQNCITNLYSLGYKIEDISNKNHADYHNNTYKYYEK